MLEVNFNPFPAIVTDRLELRETTLADAGALFKMRSDTDVMNLIDKPVPESEEEMVQLVEKIRSMKEAGEGISWAISWKGDSAFIGTLSFHRIYKEHYRAEVGYMLSRAWFRQGVMNEALKAVIGYGFGPMGLHSIEAVIKPENIPSQELVLANGFVKEGHFRENHFWQGRFTDRVVYSLINPA